MTVSVFQVCRSPCSNTGMGGQVGSACMLGSVCMCTMLEWDNQLKSRMVVREGTGNHCVNQVLVNRWNLGNEDSEVWNLDPRTHWTLVENFALDLATR